MTIEDVLKADWNIAEIDVTVRKLEHLEYIKRYSIGRYICPGKSQWFVRTSKAGDIYSDGGEKENVVIPKTIQFQQLENKPKGKEMCWGVLLEEIPKQIRDLEILSMSSCECMSGGGTKRYRFDCVTDEWRGIEGENETVEDREND